MGQKATYSFGVNDPCLVYSTHTVTLTNGTGVPKFKENGSWARYSHLLVPIAKLQHTYPIQNFRTSYYHLNSKRRMLRPKSGGNITHKAHGLILKYHLNILGKQLPSEVPYKKKYAISSHKANFSSSSTTCPTTTATIITFLSIQMSFVYLPYHNKRTKWTIAIGCEGTLTSVTI